MIQHVLHAGWKEHRGTAGFEDVVALVGSGAAFGHVIVTRHGQDTARIFDRFHMARRNIAGSSDKGIRRHVIQSLFEIYGPQPSKKALPARKIGMAVSGEGQNRNSMHRRILYQTDGVHVLL